MTHDLPYIGSELELFAKAVNWKSYLAAQLVPAISGDVLEVGSGLGGTTAFLAPRTTFGRWVCLEPDAKLAATHATTLAGETLPVAYEVVVGTLANIGTQSFDAILYIDVLEHIDDDRGELLKASARLRPGGRLVILSPAHAWLFSPFDRAIGHFRRYTKASLRALIPPSLVVDRMVYLDSVGLAASLVNRLFLKQSMPTPRQIAFWDRHLVPCSRFVDRLLLYSFGKSVLAVFQKSRV